MRFVMFNLARPEEPPFRRGGTSRVKSLPRMPWPNAATRFSGMRMLMPTARPPKGAYRRHPHRPWRRHGHFRPPSHPLVPPATEVRPRHGPASRHSVVHAVVVRNEQCVLYPRSPWTDLERVLSLAGLTRHHSFAGRNGGTHWLYRNVPFWTASECTRDILKSHGVRSVKIIRYGVNTVALPVLPEKPLGTPLRLIAVSRLAPNKRIDHAVRTVRCLADRGIAATLTIVGTGEVESQLRALVKELKLEEKVIFTRALARTAEKDEQLQRAHFLLHNSIREGWGLNVIEANAMGTPAVPFIRWVAGLIESTLHNETGLISEKETPDSMAASLIGILKSPQKYQEFRVKAWDRAKTLHWDRILPPASEWLEKQARGQNGAERECAKYDEGFFSRVPYLSFRLKTYVDAQAESRNNPAAVGVGRHRLFLLGFGARPSGSPGEFRNVVSRSDYNGDALQILGWINAASEGDYISAFWTETVHRLGAPYEANWNDYPMYEKLITFGLGHGWRSAATSTFVASNFRGFCWDISLSVLSLFISVAASWDATGFGRRWRRFCSRSRIIIFSAILAICCLRIPTRCRGRCWAAGSSRRAGRCSGATGFPKSASFPRL